MPRLIIVEDNADLAAFVASAARARGHDVVPVSTGRAALQAIDSSTFDVAVVDLLLPDTRGTEILSALRTRHVPAIAMSGVYKGDRFAREAIQQHGAVGFFEKPFDVRALLQAIEAAVKPLPDAELEELTPLEEDDGDEPLLAKTPLPADPPELELELVEALDALEPLEELTPAVPGKPIAPITPAEIQAAFALPASGTTTAEPSPSKSAPYDVVLPFGERGGVWHQPNPESQKQVLPGWSENGDLSPGLVPRLLNAFYQARHSGELRLKQGSVVKVIQVEDGQPVYAASNLASERFGRFCVRRGAVAEADLSRVSALSEAEKLRTGEAMLRLGLLTEEKRLQLLEDQVREIAWSTFGWAQGQYAVVSGRPARPGQVKLRIFPAGLILEGVRRASTLLSLRQELPAGRRLFPAPHPPYRPREIALGQPQALLLEAADGSKTVEDLLALSDLSEREALAALAGFQLLGLLEVRREESGRQRISFGL